MPPETRRFTMAVILRNLHISRDLGLLLADLAATSDPNPDQPALLARHLSIAIGPWRIERHRSRVAPPCGYNRY